MQMIPNQSNLVNVGGGGAISDPNAIMPVTSLSGATINPQVNYYGSSAASVQANAYNQGYEDALAADTAAAAQTTATATDTTASPVAAITGSAYFWPVILIGAAVWWFFGRGK